MNLLSAAEVDRMRATASEALDGTAIFQTESFVPDGGGGGTAQWTSAGTADCRLAPLNSAGMGEGVDGNRLSPNSQVIFTFPADTDIDHNARIIYGGGTFTVTAVRSRSQEITRRVEAKEVE